MKILIAEDDPVSRTLLIRNLEKWEHEVVVAEDGEQALELFENSDDIRLAILDWMMPGKEGPEVCRAIKDSNRRFTYVIILTALTDKDKIVSALDKGADDYVTKPFNAHELKARVRAGERIVRLETQLHRKIGELKDALEHVQQLQGIIPICAWCKRIRNDKDFWDTLEDYFTEHSEAEFSHSICPECRSKHFGSIKRQEQVTQS